MIVSSELKVALYLRIMIVSSELKVALYLRIMIVSSELKVALYPLPPTRTRVAIASRPSRILP
jgi:hypothetical protein